MVRNRCTHADSKIKIHEENDQKAQGNNKRQHKKIQTWKRHLDTERYLECKLGKKTQGVRTGKLCKEVDRVKQGCKTSLDCFVNVKEGIDFRL